MPYTRQELLNLVASRMDEVLPAQGEGDVITPVENLDKELDHAAEVIIKISPREHLFPIIADGSGESIAFDQNSKEAISGVIDVPVDFFRFVRLKLSDWERPVDSIISTDDLQYKRQYVSALRGSVYKPVAAIIPYANAESKRGLEYFVSAEHEIAEFSYIPKVPGENIPDILIDPLVWMTASKALAILRYSNESKYAENQAISILQNTNIGVRNVGG